jgi:hypothetical protein
LVKLDKPGYPCHNCPCCCCSRRHHLATSTIAIVIVASASDLAFIASPFNLSTTVPAKAIIAFLSKEAGRAIEYQSTKSHNDVAARLTLSGIVQRKRLTTIHSFLENESPPIWYSNSWDHASFLCNLRVLAINQRRHTNWYSRRHTNLGTEYQLIGIRIHVSPGYQLEVGEP